MKKDKDQKFDESFALIKDSVMKAEAESFLLGSDASCRCDGGAELLPEAEERILRRLDRKRAAARRRRAFGRTVAAVFIIAVAVFALSFVIPEVRAAYFGLFSKMTNRDILISIDALEDGGDFIAKAGTPTLPAGYAVKDESQMTYTYDAAYVRTNEKGEEDGWIDFSRKFLKLGSSSISVDNRGVMEDIKINGYSGVLVTYGEDSWHDFVLVFYDGTYIYFFHIIDSTMTREELLSMAESVYD